MLPLGGRHGARRHVDDASVRARRAGAGLQPERRRAAAQQGLCLRHAKARHAEARLGRSLLRPSARSRRHPDRPQARRCHHRGGAAARHHRGHRRHPRRDRPAVRLRDRRDRRWPDQDRAAATSCRARRRRPRTCASCCSPSPPTSACCWSSSPTACTTCARSTIMPRRKAHAHRQETMDIYAPLAGRMGMQDMRSELEDLSFKHAAARPLPRHHRPARRDAGRVRRDHHDHQRPS